MASRDEKMTFLVITHDIAAAMQIADTIYLMGRDRDADNSSHAVPGAADSGDVTTLAARGLAWRPNIVELPEFDELRHEIRARFASL